MYGKTKPAADAFAITPDDNNDLAVYANTLWVGNSGTVRITTVLGTTVDIVGADKHIPIQARRVHATGTTASSILGLI